MPKICNYFRFIRKSFVFIFIHVSFILSFTIIAIQKINYNNNYFWKTTARRPSVSLECFAVHSVLKLTPGSSCILTFIYCFSFLSILFRFLFSFVFTVLI